MNIKSKREELKELVLKMNVSNAGIIYQILNSKSIDIILKKITDEKTNIEGKSILKKKYLTGDEQFIVLLNQFVSFFDYHFPTINYKDLHIEYLMEYYFPNFLFCKKCCEDNNNLDYFQYEMKKAVVYNFHENIQNLYSEKDKKFWDRVKITKGMNIDDEKNVDNLFKLLKKIALANINDFSTIYLFDNYKSYLKKIDPKDKDKTAENIIKAINTTNNFYAEQYSSLLNKFIKKEEYIDEIM